MLDVVFCPHFKNIFQVVSECQSPLCFYLSLLVCFLLWPFGLSAEVDETSLDVSDFTTGLRPRERLVASSTLISSSCGATRKVLLTVLGPN